MSSEIGTVELTITCWETGMKCHDCGWSGEFDFDKMANGQEVAQELITSHGFCDNMEIVPYAKFEVEEFDHQFECDLSGVGDL